MRVCVSLTLNLLGSVSTSVLAKHSGTSRDPLSDTHHARSRVVPSDVASSSRFLCSLGVRPCRPKRLEVHKTRHTVEGARARVLVGYVSDVVS